MGDCFSFETIDMSTTHIILPNDDPQMPLTLDLCLALIYGWSVSLLRPQHICVTRRECPSSRFVTFEWLKSSSRVGEWLRENKFEPKRLFQSNPSINIYRKFRQQQKPIDLFQQSGLIYLTSIAKQRHLLLKLITLCGGNVREHIRPQGSTHSRRLFSLRSRSIVI